MNLNLPLLFPEAVATGILLILLLGEILKGRGVPQKISTASVALGSLLVFLSLLPFAGKIGSAFGEMFILDPLAIFFKGFFALTLFVVISISREYLRDRRRDGEFFLILWCSLIGLFFLVSANHFLLLFISLEIVTLSFYILAAYLKRDLLSIEAGLKYLILGSLASAFILYGVSELYIAGGSAALADIRIAFANDPSNRQMLLGILLILSGLCFKVAAVPFQLWVPDVYEGAPTPVVAYLAVGSKAAGFALLLRLLFTVFVAFDSQRILLFSVLAAMTLLYGNLGALVQTNLKRLLGYSGIGHAGYLLIGIAAGREMGTSAVIYYLIAYAFSNLTAFFVVTLAGRELGSDQISAYRGFAKRSPFLAAALFIALLSLAGVPPLAGFFGKFLILLAAAWSGLAWLALLGALGVAVSLYYYLSIVRMIYIEESTITDPIPVSVSVKFLLGVLILGIFLAGIWQAPFLHLARAAAHSLF